MKSIRAQLTVYVVLTLVVVCAGLGLISYSLAYNAMLENIEAQVSTKAVDAAQTVSDAVSKELAVIETLAANDKVQTMDLEQQMSVLEPEIERLQGLQVTGFTVSKLDGSAVSYTGEQMDIADRAYFQKAAQGTSNISDPFVSRKDSRVVVTAAVPIKDDAGNVNGVLVAGLEAAVLSKQVAEITLGESGYAFMCNEQGTFIAHPNQDLVIEQYNPADSGLTDFIAHINKMTAGETDFGEYRWTDGKTKYMGYAPVAGTGWSVAVTAPKDEVMADVTDMSQKTMAAALAFLVLGALIAIWLGAQIAKPISAAAECSKQIAENDLTIEIPPTMLQRKDEIGQLMVSMDNMVKNLRKMIMDIARNSQEVAAASEELSASSQNIASGMQETSAAVEEISAGMEEVSAAAEEINASSEEITSALTQVNSEAMQGHDNSLQVQKRAAITRDESQKALDDTNQVYGSIRGKVEKAIEESKVINEISGMAANIADIANQTNLLALNAAIEAARAGEHGKGFAVVAEEVRKLAEDSANTVDVIQKLTHQVQNAIENLTANTGELLDFINNNVTRDLSRMSTAGQYYSDDADMLTKLTEDTSRNIQQIMTAMHDVSRAIEATAATIEQSNAGSQEIARHTEIAATSASEINHTAAQLAKSAEILNNLIHQFRVS